GEMGKLNVWESGVMGKMECLLIDGLWERERSEESGVIGKWKKFKGMGRSWVGFSQQ
ncbi:hypothetical protein HAX54_022723, partial [Datura stramonium]|nr:hypothetical protein [Datura stramonium]